jgi:hypothetical protein
LFHELAAADFSRVLFEHIVQVSQTNSWPKLTWVGYLDVGRGPKDLFEHIGLFAKKRLRYLHLRVPEEHKLLGTSDFAEQGSEWFQG